MNILLATVAASAAGEVVEVVVLLSPRPTILPPGATTPDLEVITPVLGATILAATIPVAIILVAIILAPEVTEHLASRYA
jgi:hypothetical protein